MSLSREAFSIKGGGGRGLTWEMYCLATHTTFPSQEKKFYINPWVDPRLSRHLWLNRFSPCWILPNNTIVTLARTSSGSIPWVTHTVKVAIRRRVGRASCHTGSSHVKVATAGLVADDSRTPHQSIITRLTHCTVYIMHICRIKLVLCTYQ